MGSHLGAIGFPPDHPLNDALHQLMTHASHLGANAEGRVDVYGLDDPSGARTTVTLEDRRVTCLTPGFAPGTRLDVRLGALAPNDCAFERPLIVEVLDAQGGMQYPLAVTIDDLGISEPMIQAGERAVIEVVAIADQLSRFPDVAAYRASGTPMAVASLIPSGLFAPGVVEADALPVRSVALISGTVMAAELRTHSLFGHPFATVVMASLGADYRVCIDVADLGGVAAPDLPAVGSIISGEFYLSGRLAATG